MHIQLYMAALLFIFLLHFGGKLASMTAAFPLFWKDGALALFFPTGDGKTIPQRADGGGGGDCPFYCSIQQTAAGNPVFP